MTQTGDDLKQVERDNELLTREPSGITAAIDQQYSA